MGARGLALLATVVALAVDLGWRAAVVPGAGLGWGLAFGTDAPLWVLSTEGLLQGAIPAVPPGWPALAALPRLLGLPLVPAGALVSQLAGAAIPGAGAWVARKAGASVAASAGVALVLWAWPDRAPWAAEVQANGLGALALLVATGLAAQVLSGRARWAAPAAAPPGWAWLAAVLVGALPLLRENLAVVSLAAVLGLPLLVRGGAGLAAVVLATWWLSPLLVGAGPGPTPLQTPWGDRGSRALQDLGAGSGAPPAYVAELPRHLRGAYLQLLREGDTVGLVRWHAARSLALAPDAWALGAAGALTAATQGRRRPALAAVLLPLAVLAPTLVFWSQRRHLVLALPALLAVAASGFQVPAGGGRPAGQGRRVERLLLATTLLLVGLALASWPATWVRHAQAARGEALRAATLAELGAWLCQQPEPLLGGPIQDVGLYCPRPRHDPDGSAADAHTLVVAPRRQPPPAPADAWTRVGPPAADLVVYRWRPGEPRPCPQGRPAPGTPYLSAGPVHAALVGCVEPSP